MGEIVFEVLLVFILLVINGVFSMSELSIVSARKIRLQQQAEAGSKGAQAALNLAESPNNFLSTVQIGITLVGILSGAFGGATIAGFLAKFLEGIPLVAPYSAGISFAVVVGIITYFSIIIGELIPKSIALAAPEKMAALISRPMTLLSTVAAPVVWLLSAPTSFVLKIFGVHSVVDPPVTDEEIKGLIDAGTKAGVFEESEQDLLESIIHLDDRRIVSFMTPRTRIEWLDLEDSLDDIKKTLTSTRFSRLPVCQGSLDSVLGYVSARDLLSQLIRENKLDLKAVLKQPIYIPETVTNLELLGHLKESHTTFAVIIDEYGGVEGLITMNDMMEQIIGDLPISQHSGSNRRIVTREAGSWLMDGETSIEDFREALGIKEMPKDEAAQYHTVAGFVITHLGRVPAEQDAFEWGGFNFTVEKMDQNRVDKVGVRQVG